MMWHGTWGVWGSTAKAVGFFFVVRTRTPNGDLLCSIHSAVMINQSARTRLRRRKHQCVGQVIPEASRVRAIILGCKTFNEHHSFATLNGN